MTIRTFRSKGLKKFFETGSKSGIQPALANKLELILDRLDAATDPKDMNFPGSDFHPLKCDLKGFYSVHIYSFNLKVAISAVPKPQASTIKNRSI